MENTVQWLKVFCRLNNLLYTDSLQLYIEYIKASFLAFMRRQFLDYAT